MLRATPRPSDFTPRPMRPDATTSQATSPADAKEHAVPSDAVPGEADATAVLPKKEKGDSSMPRPRSPLNGALVEASAAPFSWRGKPGAEGYVLQVAREPGFSDEVFSIDAGPATSLTVYGMLEPSERELFWRVRDASQPDSWSGYGRFVAASDAAVENYRSEQATARTKATKDAAEQRATWGAELDLIPLHQRDTSLSSTADVMLLIVMMVSFLAIFGLLLVVA